MEMLTYLSINIFPIVMLLIILFNNYSKMEQSRASHYFEVITLVTILLMMVEIAGNWVEEISAGGPDLRLWALSLARMILRNLIACAWLCYISYRLYENGVRRRTKYISWFAHGVFAISCVGILLAPSDAFVSFACSTGTAVSKAYYRVISVENAILMLLSIGVAIYVYRHDDIREKRTECRFLMGFGVIFLLSIFMQYYSSEWKLAGAAIAIAILYIYVNTQNRQITTDSLTGLNNRREFDKHLRRMAEQSDHGWGMLMMDMDDFKWINDNLGHAAGDEALCEMADILRQRLGKGNAFLARYGGDEFAAVGAWENVAQIHEAIAELNGDIGSFNSCGNKEYELSVSVGYALWKEDAEDVVKLLEKADSRMYETKQAKKKERRNR